MPDHPTVESAARPGDLPTGASGPLRRLFIGPAGLRAGWSFLLFVGLLLLAKVAFGLVWERLIDPPPSVPWNPVWTAVDEAFTLAAVLFGMVVMGRVEGRSFGEYGLVFRRLLGRRFWEGTLWGLAMVAGVVLPLWAVGGYSVTGLETQGAALQARALDPFIDVCKS